MEINGQLHGNYMLKIETRIAINDPRIITKIILWKLMGNYMAIK